MDIDKITQRLHHRVKRASLDYGLIAPNDHVLVCLSGGKDSYTLLSLLRAMQKRLPFPLTLTAFHLDQGQPGYPPDTMRRYLEAQDVPHRILAKDTYSVVKQKVAPDATPCALCSRMRRGIIYKNAQELGCNKIALGHHRDDSIETVLLNMLHAGQLQAMPAKYTTDDGAFEVIRPLILCAEEEIEAYATAQGFPIIPCNLCGSHEGRRTWVKRLLTQIEETVPQARGSLLASLQNVRPSHLLDTSLHEALAAHKDMPHEEEDDILRLVSNRPATP